MRARKVALTAFLLGPLIVLVVLCWLIALEIDRQNRATGKHPSPAAQNPPAGPHG
jgi:hypothetical protein